MRGIKKGKPLKLKKSLELNYKRELLKLVKAMYKGLSRQVLQLFKTKDLIYIKQMLETIEKQHTNIVEIEAGGIINNFVNTFKKDIKKDLGIGWSFEYEDRLKADILNNVALIKNIPEKAFFEITQEVLNSVADDNKEALEFKLQERYGITARRAEVIARDQTSKLFSTMNEISQISNGFEYYMWMTANDERVSIGKGGHKQLNRKIYKWNETIEERKPIIDNYGNRGKPGERVNCRCIAYPIIVEKDFKMVWDSSIKSYRAVRR